MGVRVKGTSAVIASIRKEGDQTTRAMRHVQQQAGEALAETARRMVPVDEGHMESSIQISTRTEGRRTVTDVTAGDTAETQAYATWLHEAVYNLGPKSQAKNASGQFPVGRKFMTRALRWLETEWGLMERMRTAAGKK